MGNKIKAWIRIRLEKLFSASSLELCSSLSLHWVRLPNWFSVVEASSTFVLHLLSVLLLAFMLPRIFLVVMLIQQPLSLFALLDELNGLNLDFTGLDNIRVPLQLLPLSSLLTLKVLLPSILIILFLSLPTMQLLELQLPESLRLIQKIFSPMESASLIKLLEPLCW